MQDVSKKPGPPVPREVRKQRIRNYLTGHPEATARDLKAAGLSSDLSLGYNYRINDARKELGIGPPPYRPRPVVPPESRKQKIRDYLTENPEADLTDLKAAGLSTDLRLGYENKISAPRKEMGINPYLKRIHKNTLYSDLWSHIILPKDQKMEAELLAVIEPLLEHREYQIASMYYGLGCEKQNLDNIGKFCSLTRERVRQIMLKVVPKLSYQNNQKLLASVCTQYVTDPETKKFLESVPYYNEDFLPWRLDQLYLSNRSRLNRLHYAGIVTIGQFLEELPKKSYNKTRWQQVVMALEKLGISAYAPCRRD